MGDAVHTGAAARPEGAARGEPLSLPRVEITVRDAGTCPVLASGGRMVYAHPEVLKFESGRICAQAIATAAPVAEEVARAAAEGRRMAPLEITCIKEGCGAVLVVQALPFGADGVTATPAPAPRSGGTSVTPPPPPPPKPPKPPKPSGFTPLPPAPPQPPTSPPSSGSSRSSASSRRTSFQTQIGRLSPMTGGGPFLSRLDTELIEEIVELSQAVHCPEPTVIIRERQEGEALYIVATGEVEVLREMEGGQEMRLALVGKGACLGEMSLLTGQPASATVRTRGEDTVVLMLPTDTLEALLTRRPTLHREFSRIIAQRLYSTNVRLEANSSRGISGNLSMIGVVDLVQTLHASRRTGTLSVKDGRGLVARVGLGKGSVSSAIVADVPGAEGFFELLTWSDGTFSFEGGEPSLDAEPTAVIQGDTMALLMEGLRRLDERGR
ncbi:MAG: cyclic nucleotide-binding domain-containing protein [Planctomycetota bacterium]